MSPLYTYGDGPGGKSSCLSIGLIALPCPGVALRFSTVIDCTPGTDRMPPVTIDFLLKSNNLPPQPQQLQSATTQNPVTTAAANFTFYSGDLVLFSQLRRVEEMVAAAGLPRDCAPSVEDFFHLSASHAANSFYKAMAITVEAGSPGTIMAVDEYEEEDEEVLTPGAVVGDCAICYREYLVGGATAVKLAMCSHSFHRRCLDRWTVVSRTCPCCRAPVPEEEEQEEDHWDEDDCDDSDSDSDSDSEYEYDVPGVLAEDTGARWQ